ncbi:MAG: amino acid ABC transporter substrate-binding protein [Deltaproteobacteria bacterium]|nr:amino acid ABC transporter substrate-binding protein [Deltaproteobacteria bacterium]MBI2347867.1 amino acid ABC transporter substrate-binding protein [Deltaproteobacteria bacterium]MBI2992531.1 amino acid ABC transporter substrate-binding protein [Deltaproteobacteria bacterium]
MKTAKQLGTANQWILLLCLGLVLFPWQPVFAQAPIKIGASLSLTGSYAALGQNQHRGYQLCTKHANEKGGVLGRKVEFVLYDDQSLPATGVRLYERLITQDKVDAIMGPYSSAITEAVANVNERYKMPMVAPMASTTAIFRKGRKFIFMVQSAAEVYLEGLIDMAAKRGLKSVAIINEDTLFPKATVQGTIDLAKKKGLQVVFVEGYPKGNTDFSAILTKVRAASPDVFGAATYFDDAVAITRQMKELNVNPKMYGVTVGGDLPKFYELLGKNAEFVYGATQWEPELPYPGAKEFTESYKKEFSGADLSYHSAGGYAGCQILVEAIKRARSLDGEKIRAEIAKLDTTTVYGGFKVDEGGFQISHKMVMFQWQNGKKVIVWPDELAGGKARFPTPQWSQR